MPRFVLADRFPALQSRDFRNLWMANIISAAGSQMQFAALNWQIYDLTGSPVALGLIGLVRILPIFCFSLLGGTVADSRDRRLLMLITQSIMTLVALTLSLLSWMGGMSVTAIYVLTAIGAGAVAFDNPARQSLLPNLVPREHLPNAASLGVTGFQVATIVGPVLAGLILGRFGPAWAYAINAISFLAVITALLTLRYRPEPVTKETPRIGFIESLKEGIAFVRSTPILIATMVLDFVATFFSSANALLPIFAKDVLKVGPEGFGILSAAPAVGSLITGATLTLMPPIQRQGKALLLAVIAYGLFTIGFGFADWFVLSVLMLAGTGAADSVSTVQRQTIRQLVTPDHLRGRMVAINMLFFMGGPQLGELEAGLVAQWFGPVVSVVSGGIATVLCAGATAARAPWLYRYRLTKE